VFSSSISRAIDFGVKLLAESSVEPHRRGIDISGDGPNNSGRDRHAGSQRGRGSGDHDQRLAFLLKRPSGMGDSDNLDLYYQDCVIGGPGGFIIPVRDRTQFAAAIRTKLVREIAGEPDREPLVKPAQDRERLDCLVGKMQR
jgi:uncharacterized protein DUF1194